MRIISTRAAGSEPSPFKTDRSGQGLCILLVLCSATFGCTGSGSAGGPPPPKAAEVQVSTPVVKTVTDFEDFTGHVEAMRGIDVRARVSGYLDKVLFKEGMEVEEGTPLFEIDRRTYQADYDRAGANLTQAKAHLTRLEADYQRAASLIGTKAISQADFDQAAGDRDEAAAAVKVAEAALHTSRLNLDFTTVTAFPPIAGRISRQMIDPGNLVKADDTVLTTVVSFDPIYAYFDVDERTMLRIQRLVRAGKVKSAQQAEVKIRLELADEQGYPHEGTINFIDNRMDEPTGTLRLRGVFPNPNRVLSPGLFARVRIPIGDPHPAILVSERALGSDQGQKFLFVLNKDDEVAYRRVQIGKLEEGLRVIESGLQMGERVVLSGLQRVKSGDKVAPKLVAMTGQETFSSPGAATAAAAEAPAGVAATATSVTPVANVTSRPVAEAGPPAKPEQAAQGRSSY